MIAQFSILCRMFMCQSPRTCLPSLVVYTPYPYTKSEWKLPEKCDPFVRKSSPRPSFKSFSK